MLEDDAKLLLEALPDTRGLIGREILDDEVKLLVSVTPNKRGMIGAGTRVRGEFNVMRAKVRWIIGHNACLYLLTIHGIPDIPDTFT